jgi:hypothetical protein
MASQTRSPFVAIMWLQFARRRQRGVGFSAISEPEKALLGTTALICDCARKQVGPVKLRVFLNAGAPNAVQAMRHAEILE